jgi:lipopolysaccharide transport system permease protein
LLALDPMRGAVEGFRWALLGRQPADAQPPESLFAVSVAVALLVLLSGRVFFRATERTFADVV